MNAALPVTPEVAGPSPFTNPETVAVKAGLATPYGDVSSAVTVSNAVLTVSVAADVVTVCVPLQLLVETAWYRFPFALTRESSGSVSSPSLRQCS